jgi:hypothetical protein
MAMATGCSIPVVRAHGVGVDWVQFPAARPNKIFLLKVLIVRFLQLVQNKVVITLIVDKRFASARKFSILNRDT